MIAVLNILKTLLEPLHFILPAFPLTVLMLLLSTLFGSLLGMVLTYVRLKKRRIPCAIATAFISFMRGTPPLVQLFIIYFGVPRFVGLFGIDLGDANPIIFAVIAFSLNTAAFISETFRSSYLAVDKGQQEAALSVGLNGWQAFHRIILPQAFKIGLPSIGNLVIELLKDTSLAYTIGVLDLMGKASQFISLDYGIKLVQTYLVVDLIYWISCSLIERAIAILEKTFSKGNMEITANRS